MLSGLPPFLAGAWWRVEATLSRLGSEWIPSGAMTAAAAARQRAFRQAGQPGGGWEGVEGRGGRKLSRALDHGRDEEGVSGSKPLNERPAGKALLAALKPGDVVVAAKLDRMFRSAVDALNMVEEFKRRKVSLHLIDLGGDVVGNGISKLFFTILSAVAEAERDRIRSRVKETKADQRKRKRHLGGHRPFGYRVEQEDGKSRGGKLVPDAREQAAIVKMRELRASGMALRAIAQAMQEEGFRISHEGVGNVLSRE